MKVIIHCNRKSGVDYHRLVRPFELLQGNGLEVEWIDSPERRMLFDLEVIGRRPPQILDGATHVIGSRFWRYKEMKGIQAFILAMRNLGIKTILDNDDHWIIPKHNLAYLKYHVTFNFTYAVQFSIVKSDEVWVTQKRLAEETRKLNKNVHIVPNGIASQDAQWQKHDWPTEQMRFGYIAGDSHYRDLSWSGINLEGIEGYVVNHKAEVTEEDLQKALSKAETGEQQRLIKEHKLLIDGATRGQSFKEIIGAKHELKFLPVTEYAENYRNLDVSLIPLRPSTFNSMKSNLKLLEAGFAKKAAIVSNVYPYSEGLKPNDMCIAVGGSPIKSQDWNKVIKNLTHRQAVDIAEGLHDWVQKYELNRVNKVRSQLLLNNL